MASLRHPLPHAAERQVGEVLVVLRETVGVDLVGVYLHGSAVLGGLRPFSDVDVLAVSRRPTTLSEQRQIVDRLLALSGRRAANPGRPLEVTIVAEPEIRPWRYPPRMDLQYGEWLRDAFERDDVEPGPTTNPDLAVLIEIVLLGDAKLLGPPPAEVFDPIPNADLVDAMVSGLDGLLEEVEQDTRNVLLTLARIWCTVATGEIRSKDDAATWALGKLPAEHRDLLERARAIYLGEEDEQWGDLVPRLRPHADHVVGEIRRLTAGAPCRADVR